MKSVTDVIRNSEPSVRNYTTKLVLSHFRGGGGGGGGEGGGGQGILLHQDI